MRTTTFASFRPVAIPSAGVSAGRIHGALARSFTVYDPVCCSSPAGATRGSARQEPRGSTAAK